MVCLPRAYAAIVLLLDAARQRLVDRRVGRLTALTLAASLQHTPAMRPTQADCLGQQA
jgi:hypothetical protein